MTWPAPEDVQAAFCAVLVDEWARGGVRHAVVAPGSRSTPLLLALDDDERLQVHVVLDERSAGFVALGIGMGSGLPAVVLTTSGTAAAELHPCVIEASYAGVPLIAATADRPPELHGIGAPQTIDQEGLFGSAARWAFSPGMPDIRTAGAWRSIGSRSVAEALGCAGARPGPVQLNLAFAEPLIGLAAGVELPEGRADGAPWHRVDLGVPDPPEDAVELLASHAGERGLIVAGAGTGDPLRILAAAGRLGWPVLADPRSGCRGREGPVVAAADALLRVEEIASWKPDIVVRAGSPWASKVLSQWLAGLGPGTEQLVVGFPVGWSDPERSASRVVAADPGSLLSRAAERAAPRTSSNRPSDWLDGWLEAERAAQSAIEAELRPGGALEMSEPAVARAVLAGLPEGGQLFVASSMPVRDVEWWGAPRGRARVLANRGANGIDGVLSSALGAALGSGAPTVALLGDLAFMYDVGVLVAAMRAPGDVALTALVVDNDGGGIFSFLAQATSLPGEQFERYWGTPHGVRLLDVAASFGATAIEIAKPADLDEVLARATAPGITVAVVSSDRRANVENHDQLIRAVACAVAVAVAP